MVSEDASTSPKGQPTRPGARSAEPWFDGGGKYRGKRRIKMSVSAPARRALPRQDRRRRLSAARPRPEEPRPKGQPKSPSFRLRGMSGIPTETADKAQRACLPKRLRETFGRISVARWGIKKGYPHETNDVCGGSHCMLAAAAARRVVALRHAAYVLRETSGGAGSRAARRSCASRSEAVARRADHATSMSAKPRRLLRRWNESQGPERSPAADRTGAQVIQ